ncbi:MAG: M20/M25/M40 family metallo-hydrolase [Deltaproteobacteria bacterium]|nr:M20/M25/M40 family metallo-hydrolase [Deltaproteobacteria bacterium]
MLDREALKIAVEKAWNESICDELCRYIRIPNKSPAFDSDWQKNGYMAAAMEQVVSWCRRQNVEGMTIQELSLPDRTPLLLIEVEGNGKDTVLLYGHIDKQPEMTGWSPGKGPWQPVIEGDRLYGRGGADDGYAVFASLTAIRNLQEQGCSHSRCVLVIEASEESGSDDLPAYLEHFGDRIGQPDLVLCLDSGCGDYETLWATSSLRGLLTADLHIRIQQEGMHSGKGSGVVPGWHQLLSLLLSRIEDPVSGRVFPPELNAEIPYEHQQQAGVTADLIRESFFSSYSFPEGSRALSEDVRELLLNQTWRPTLTVTGLDGVPLVRNAGNVTLPDVRARLSLRLPPTCQASVAARFLKETMEKDPPFGAHVSLVNVEVACGWKTPDMEPWLVEALNKASLDFFGRAPAFIGEGGSIPFMGMLGKSFPEAQFLITGLLGPRSNAHGPDEFLHIPMFKKLTAAISSIIDSHYRFRKGGM